MCYPSRKTDKSNSSSGIDKYLFSSSLFYPNLSYSSLFHSFHIYIHISPIHIPISISILTILSLSSLPSSIPISIFLLSPIHIPIYSISSIYSIYSIYSYLSALSLGKSHPFFSGAVPPCLLLSYYVYSSPILSYSLSYSLYR